MRVELNRSQLERIFRCNANHVVTLAHDQGEVYEAVDGMALEDFLAAINDLPELKAEPAKSKADNYAGLHLVKR